MLCAAIEPLYLRYWYKNYLIPLACHCVKPCHLLSARVAPCRVWHRARLLGYALGEFDHVTCFHIDSSLSCRPVMKLCKVKWHLLPVKIQPTCFTDIDHRNCYKTDAEPGSNIDHSIWFIFHPLKPRVWKFISLRTNMIFFHPPPPLMPRISLQAIKMFVFLFCSITSWKISTRNFNLSLLRCMLKVCSVIESTWIITL